MEGMRLELELTRRTAAQLKLKLNDLKEDHEHLLVRHEALTAQHAAETRGATAAEALLADAIASIHDQEAALAASSGSVADLQVHRRLARPRRKSASLQQQLDLTLLMHRRGACWPLEPSAACCRQHWNASKLRPRAKHANTPRWRRLTLRSWTMPAQRHSSRSARFTSAMRVHTGMPRFRGSNSALLAGLIHRIKSTAEQPTTCVAGAATGAG